MLAVAVVSLVAVIGFCVMLYKALAPFAERRRDADRAFCSAARYESRNPRQRFRRLHRRVSRQVWPNRRQCLQAASIERASIQV